MGNHNAGGWYGALGEQSPNRATSGLNARRRTTPLGATSIPHGPGAPVTCSVGADRLARRRKAEIRHLHTFANSAEEARGALARPSGPGDGLAGPQTSAPVLEPLG